MASGGRHGVPQATGVRASDAEREQAVALLRDHYEAGRLSEDDLSERIGPAYGARTVPGLPQLLTDLPSPRAVRRHRRGGYETSVRIHFTTYLLVNLMLIGIWAASGGGYFWPIWPLLGWGIGVGCHAAPLIATRGRRRHRHDSAPALVPPRPSRPPRPPRQQRIREAEETSVDEVAST